MSVSQPSWETLNAYVDGELPAAEAAAVARALAENGSLAGRVATLARLKATVEDSVEAVDIALPAPRRRAWRPAALAASLALALAIGAALYLAPWGGADHPALLAEAQTVHEAWAGTDETAPAPIGAGIVLAALHNAGPGAYLPDLTAARLSLARIEPVTLPSQDGPALHIGYRGTRGCRVSLLVVAGGAALPVAFTRYDDGPARSYAWRTGTHGYLLTATGMDEARLALIARTVHRASLEHSPFDGETRSALAESRERSVPCQA